MAKTEPFNLGLEVETYLNRLDNNLLLDTEESDELFDHFHCEVEELTLIGLSEQEAFEVSKLRFGEQAVIRTELKKVKPLKAIYKHLLIGLVLVFSIKLITSIVQLTSILNLLIVSYWELGMSATRYADFALKFVVVLLLITGLFLMLKKGKLNGYLLFSLPFASLICYPLIPYINYQLLTRLVNHQDKSYAELLYYSNINSEIIMLISYLFLMGIIFFLWRKTRDSLQFTN